MREGRIPAPAIGADEAYAAIEHPERRGLAHAAARIDIIVLAIARARARVDDHDLEWAKLMADALELGLHIARRHHIAVVKMPEVELHGRLVAPFERHLVDAHRGLAARLQPVVHRRE